MDHLTYKRPLQELLNIKYPLIQAGMIWCSPWQLAAEVSNCGGLGVIGAGSMYPDVLEEHIIKCKKATQNPFAINLPMLYPQIEILIDIILKYKVEVVITSAGNPKKFTSLLKENGVKVLHVVSSLKFALKAEAAGVDAVIAEGFEAGGHNGADETTTLCLIPLISKSIKIPVIAAGGIATGSAMYAAISLGAQGVQIGSRFVASVESSAHSNFKNEVVKANEGDTSLTLKEVTPVRLLKNQFYNELQDLYATCPTSDVLKAYLGRARAKKGMFEGDLNNGELEIGQVSAIINEVKSAKKIFEEIIEEFKFTQKRMSTLQL